MNGFDAINEMDAAMRSFFGSFENGRNAVTGEFFSPNPIPIYRRGYATVRDPQGRWAAAPLPYIEYEVVEQAFQGQRLMSATIWNRVPGQRGHFGLVYHVLGQFKRRLRGGLVLPVGDNGGVIMRLNYAQPFPAADSDDPNAQEITRGELSYWLSDFTP